MSANSDEEAPDVRDLPGGRLLIENTPFFRDKLKDFLNHPAVQATWRYRPQSISSYSSLSSSSVASLQTGKNAQIMKSGGKAAAMLQQQVRSALLDDSRGPFSTLVALRAIPPGRLFLVGQAEPYTEVPAPGDKMRPTIY